MNMRVLLMSTLILFTFRNTLTSQDLYKPRNISKAFKNETRSMNGSPGKNYWQNEGKYDINVMLTPETRTVTGTENIIYSNNSPDTLRTIVIRFVNNYHKPLAPRPFQASPDILTSGLDIKSFAVDKEVYDVNS